MPTDGTDRRVVSFGRIVLLGLLLAIAIGIVFLSLHKSAPTRVTARSQASPKRWEFPRRGLDESGFEHAKQVVMASLSDPTSLEDIRAAYHHAGYRGIPSFRSRLVPSELEAIDQMLSIAFLYSYEGDFLKASAILEEARELADRDHLLFAKGLPSLIFLQGVLALRRGEVENCVACPCKASCIFPIQSQATHSRREGSRQAVKFFLEYLEGDPEDVGVQWLLNLAHMTLGTYPKGIPTQYRLPLEPFHSEFNIGRFVDLAPSLGLDRLHWAGGAIMDDFDNDGWLDLVETSSDPEQSMAFYRNQGDGTFRDKTKEAGLESQWGGLQCMQTDYNNDGWLDIFVCRGGWTMPQRQSLLRNNKDGTFIDVTKQTGLLKPINSQVAAWADYDNDGWLDLFVGGESVPSRLYHNRRDGTFEEVAGKAGVANIGGACKGATGAIGTRTAIRISLSPTLMALRDCFITTRTARLPTWPNRWE